LSHIVGASGFEVGFGLAGILIVIPVIRSDIDDDERNQWEQSQFRDQSECCVWCLASFASFGRYAERFIHDLNELAILSYSRHAAAAIPHPIHSSALLFFPVSGGGGGGSGISISTATSSRMLTGIIHEPFEVSFHWCLVMSSKMLGFEYDPDDRRGNLEEVLMVTGSEIEGDSSVRLLAASEGWKVLALVIQR
jgi:hypothetical protein